MDTKYVDKYTKNPLHHQHYIMVCVETDKFILPSHQVCLVFYNGTLLLVTLVSNATTVHLTWLGIPFNMPNFVDTADHTL